MPEPRNEEERSAHRRELDIEVGARETRKLRARRQQDRTIWFGLGAFGLIGWAVAIPTLLGIALGLWIDLHWPSRFSWTLALLLAGAALGSLNAWYWVDKEQQAMDRERESNSDE